MGRLHVCSLAKVPALVRESGAGSLVTLIDKGTPVARPPTICVEQHLLVSMSDIVVAVNGHILPSDSHVAALLDFVQRWDRAAPMLIHCYAGVSRSTAAAFIAACALSPHRSEDEIAAAILFAAADDAAFMNGENISINGGMTI